MTDSQLHLLNQDIHRAISNNLILSKIFNYLDLTSIRNVRLVCTAWSNEATNILGTRTKLNIFKMFDVSKPTSSFQLDSNLAQNISIGFYHRTMPAVTDTMKLISFFTANHIFVQQLRYVTICEILPLFEVLQALPFPALQKIEIHFYTFTLNKRKAVIPSEAVRYIQRKPNLRYIKIYCKSNTYNRYPRGVAKLRAEGFDCNMDTGLKLSLQNLINSAPNLNSFEYTLSPFVPDLSQCKTIKRTELHIYQKGSNFAMDQLKVTLEQMSSSLEDLIVDSSCEQLPQAPSSLKSFPKLKKLTLIKTRQFIQLIEPNRFPTLKSLVMRGHDLDKYISSFTHVMKTVKSVTMIKVYSSAFFTSDYKYSFLPKKLKPLFPNATEIIYQQYWKHLDCVNDRGFAKYLESLLKVCEEQKINCLDVIVSRVKAFPIFMRHKYIKGVKVEFKYFYQEDAQSIKSVEWRCDKVYYLNSDLSATEEDAEMLMNILLSTKNMASVLIHNMFLGLKYNKKLWTRICSFVEQHELPVHFSYTSMLS